MEAVVISAIEAIALRGVKGVSIPEVWDVAQISSLPIPPCLRDFFWRQLMEHANDLHFYLPAETSSDPVDKQATALKPKKSRSKVIEDHTLPPDDPNLSSFERATAQGVRIRATRALQDPAMGIASRATLRFALSAPQQRVLEMLAEAGSHGMLQSELAKELKMEGRNFGYVTKMLEQRGLVVKVPAVVRGRTQKGNLSFSLDPSHSSTVSTNLLLLSRFASDEVLRGNVRVSDGFAATFVIKGRNDQEQQQVSPLEATGIKEAYPDDSSMSNESDVELSDHDEFDKGEKRYRRDGRAKSRAKGSLKAESEEDKEAAIHDQFQTDDQYYHNICGFLASTPNQMVLERALKVALGYQGTPRGHRQWRRHRGELVRLKCIRRFNGQNSNGKVSSYIQLLKMYKSEDLSDGIGSSRMADTPGINIGPFAHIMDPARPKRLLVCGNQVAEWNLDRQMLSLLASSGVEGITSDAIEAELKMNTKRNQGRFDNMGHRIIRALADDQKHTISSNGTVKVNRGRQILNKFVAPAALIADILQANMYPSLQDDAWRYLTDQQQLTMVPRMGQFSLALQDAIDAGGDFPSKMIATETALQAGMATPDGAAMVGNGVGSGLQGRGVEGVPVPSQAPNDTMIDGNGMQKKRPRPHEDDTHHQAVGEHASGEKKAGSGRMHPNIVVEGSRAEEATMRTLSSDRYRNRKRKKTFVTEIGINRRNWLVELVRDEGLILSAEVARLLQAKERAAGNPKAVLPDAKVWQRALKAAMDEGLIKTLEVLIPIKIGTGATRSTLVLVDPSTEQDSLFMEKVVSRDAELQKSMRIGSHMWRRGIDVTEGELVVEGRRIPLPSKLKDTIKLLDASAKNEADAADEQREDNAPGGMPFESFWKGKDITRFKSRSRRISTMRQIIGNGFLGAKMLRAKALYEGAWRVVERRGNARSSAVDQRLIDGTKSGRVFVVSHSPAWNLDKSKFGGDGGDDDMGGKGITNSAQENEQKSDGNRLDMQVFTGSDEEYAHLFSADELWQGLSLEVLCIAVGSRCANTAALQRLKSKGVCVGELSWKQLKSVLGGSQYLPVARSTMSRLLELLHRMGLVSTVVLCGKEGGSLARAVSGVSTAYMLSRNAYVEESPSSTDRKGATEVIDGGTNVESLDTQCVVDGTSGFESRLVRHRMRHRAKDDGRDPERGADADPRLEIVEVHVEKIHSNRKSVLYDYDVTSQVLREEYWQALQLISFRGTMALASIDISNCFPFCSAPESANERAWAVRSNVNPPDIGVVHAALIGRHASSSREDMAVDLTDAGQISPHDAAELARRLNVSFETVVLALTRITRTRKSRLKGKRSSRRLGGLGSKVASGMEPYDGTKRSRQRSGARRDGAPASDEDVSDLELLDLGQEDENDMQQTRNLPMRKKKWYPDEDRRLLQAWARFIAMHGLDKILRWRHVSERPTGVLPVSCRNRIAALRRTPGTAANMLRIQELASSIFSDRISQRVQADVVAATEPFTNDEEIEPPQKRQKPIHLGDTINVKQDTELPELFKSIGGGGETALSEIMSQIEATVAIAPNRYSRDRDDAVVGGDRWRGGRLSLQDKNIPLKRLDKLSCDAGTSNLVFNRLQQSTQEAAASSRSLQMVSIDTAAVMEILRSAFSAMLKCAYARDDAALHLVCQRSKELLHRYQEATILEAILKLIRRGHLSVHCVSCSVAEQAPPSIYLTDRFAFDLHPLFLDKSAFVHGRDVKMFEQLAHARDLQEKIRILPYRHRRRSKFEEEAFSEDDDDCKLVGGTISCILSYICRQRVLLRCSIPRTILHQGLRLQSETRALETRKESRNDANDATSQSRNATEKRSNGDMRSTNAEQDEDVDERVKLILGHVRVSAVGRSLNLDDQGNSSAPPDTDKENACETRISFSKSFEYGGSHIDCSFAGVGRVKLAVDCSERVLFQPFMVAIDPATSNLAVQEARQAFSIETEVFDGHGAEYFDAILEALTRAGPHGLSLDRLSNGMRGFEGERPASSSSHRDIMNTRQARGRWVGRVLCRYGLARCIPAYGSFVIVGAKESQHAVLWPSVKSIEDFLSETSHLSLPAPGSAQMLTEVRSRPWIDPLGRLIKELWQGLVKRALSVVHRHPGVSQAVLLQALSAVNPSHAREVLHFLCSRGCLYSVQISPRTVRGKKKSAMASCFGDELDDHDGGGGEPELQPEEASIKLSNPGLSHIASSCLPDSTITDLMALCSEFGGRRGADGDEEGEEEEEKRKFFIGLERCWDFELDDLIPPQVLVEAE